MSKGMILIGGYRFEVTSVSLRNARFEIIAQAPGPCPVLTGMPVAVFGADGMGVMMGGAVDVHREAREGEILQVLVTHRITSIEEEV